MSLILQSLKKGMDAKKESVERLLQRAQELLENNKDAKKDTGSQQQYQRLRFNTSDLKVRSDAVSSPPPPENVGLIWSFP